MANITRPIIQPLTIPLVRAVTDVFFGASGPIIRLSSATIAEDASVGDLVGTLSVSNGAGTYTFTLTDDAGGLFAIDGDDLEVAAALSDGSYSITVEADNGVDPPISRSFTITVTDAVQPANEFTATRISQGIF